MAYNDKIPSSQREILEDLLAPEVQALAKALAQVLPRHFNMRTLPTRKPECIQLVLDALKADSDFAEVFAALPFYAKHTISSIVHDPNLTIDYARYQALYGVSPSLPASGGSGKKEGNLLSAFISNVGTIPPVLAERLLPLVPAPVQPAAVYQPGELLEATDLWIHATEVAACRDLLAVLLLIEQKAIKVGPKTGLITEAGARPLHEALLAGDYYAPDEEPGYDDDVQIGARGIKPFAWALLVQAGGLATINGSKLELTAKGTKAHRQPPEEILRTLWERWLKYTGFHEFSRLEEIKGQKSASHPLYKPLDARKAISNTLAQLEVNRWIDLDDFFTFMFAIGESFTVVRNAWELYRDDADHGSFGYDHITWQHLNGRYAMAFLLEYCATLGIIDVGITLPWEARDDRGDLWGWDDVSCMSRYDGLSYIRLTPLGAWILGVTNTYVPCQNSQTG